MTAAPVAPVMPVGDATVDVAKDVTVQASVEAAEPLNWHPVEVGDDGKAKPLMVSVVIPAKALAAALAASARPRIAERSVVIFMAQKSANCGTPTKPAAEPMLPGGTWRAAKRRAALFDALCSA